MKNLLLLSVLGIGLMAAPAAHAQPVGFAVGIGPTFVGPAPVCTFGYYPSYPYACAPYGYYGPEWFSGGLFIGAGPWGHGFVGRSGYYGRPGFYGRPGYAGRPGFDARAGFRGGAPARGAVPAGRAPAASGFHSFARGGAAGGFHGGGRGR
jgi:hypothetical protein